MPHSPETLHCAATFLFPKNCPFSCNLIHCFWTDLIRVMWPTHRQTLGTRYVDMRRNSPHLEVLARRCGLVMIIIAVIIMIQRADMNVVCLRAIEQLATLLIHSSGWPAYVVHTRYQSSMVQPLTLTASSASDFVLLTLSAVFCN